jgi:hypothetical protein
MRCGTLSIVAHTVILNGFQAGFTGWLMQHTPSAALLLLG